MDNLTLENNSIGYSVLVVDLDHTLTATDTLIESVLLFLKSHPLYFFHIFCWMLKGKSYFKDRLAQRVCPEAATLPYRQEVLEYIIKAKASGIQVMLATASHHRIANCVAEHLGLFSEVLATNVETNLSGRNKLTAVLARTGERPFAYVGDAFVDIPLWEAADTAILIEPPAALLRRLEGHPRIEILQSEQHKSRLQAWVKALRLHQWSKNFLIFIPAILDHRLGIPDVFFSLILAFLSVSLCSSSIYLINDSLDIEADRQHFRKKKRPLPSGNVSIRQAIFLIPILLFISYRIALSALPLHFLYFLIIYLVLTLLYSFYLKQKIIIDVVLLASLYTLRVIVGAIAIDLLVSSWLLAFSMFFFLSLALVKRYSELVVMQEDVKQLPGRGYMRSDAETVMVSGIASGQLSLLVFALFMNDPRMQEFYGKPDLLWFVLPVLFYWLTRLWMIAHRGELIEDPIVFTIKDSVSYAALIIIILIMLAASQQIGSFFPVSFLAK